MASPDFTGKIMKRTPFRSGANLSRDGRYISWIDDFDILSVYSTLQTSNASSHVIGQVLWKASTVRWYHVYKQLINHRSVILHYLVLCGITKSL